jgi:anti-sigma-K factor RskA
LNPQEYENLAPLYALGALDGDDLARFSEELKRSEALRALVKEYQDAATALPLSLPPMTPSAGLKTRVMAAATGQQAPRRAVLSRVFWAAAAVALFAIVIHSLGDGNRLPFVVQPPAAGATGRLKWWKDGKVSVEISGLPALPSGKVYQLWHIGPVKDPVPCRTFTLDASGDLDGEDIMTHAIARGHKFALTVEPAGGSKSPTMPIYVLTP